MSLSDFIDCWGTESASLFIRTIADNPALLQHTDVRNEMKKLADNLQSALTSAQKDKR